jgi:hypothetical protein
MGDLFSLKQAVHATGARHLRERILYAEASMGEARLSGLSETKSSAGDKHETARAMAQQELEKQATALQHLQMMEALLLRIDPARRCTGIVPGALVATDQGHYYVGVALGKIEMEGNTVMAISMQAPILTMLSTLAVGGSGTFNGRPQRLLAIV